MTTVPRSTLWITVAGVLAVLAYAALAAVQILVLNPLAAAPGLTLDEIMNDITAATPAAFEPTISSVVTKIPLFPFATSNVATA